MKYRVLALPDHRILSLEALRKVDVLVRNGATVLGFKPLKAVSLVGGEKGRAEFMTLADQLWGEGVKEKTETGIRKVGKGRIAWGMKARNILLKDGLAPDVEFIENSEDSDLRWIHYRIGENEVYFVCNQKPIEESATAIFRCSNKTPEFWDAVSGSIREASTFNLEEGRTTVPLKFGPNGSMFVVFRSHAKSSQNEGPNFPTWKEKKTIAGPWKVSFDSKWGGPEEQVLFNKLISWTDHSDLGVKNYSGKAIYRNTFNIGNELAGKPLAIELGEVKDVGMARVRLNGTDLGVVWQPPFRVDVSKAIKSGENNLEVMVVNSWRNRLIGDNKLPENTRLTRTNIKVIEDGKQKWKLEESGLLGPVRITEKIKRN